MSVSNEFVWLLNQLRNAASPRERLRLLALGYRTLRDLSPSDRRRVAHELGVEGAEQLVEQLARRGGASPAVLMEALRRLESTDPEQLRSLIGSLVDPDRRPEIVERALDGAVQRLVEESRAPGPEQDGEPSSLPEPPGEPVSPAARQTLPPQPPPPPPAPEEAVVELIEAVPPAPRRPHPVDPTDVGVDDGAAVSEGELEPPPPPVREPELPTARPVVPGAPAMAVQPTPATLEPDEPPAAVVAEAGSLVIRLRRLARSAEGLAEAEQAELVGVLERFPPGWARRRALETLLRAGVPERVDDALALIDTVDDAVGRLWALTTLVATRPLEADEVEAVLGSASSGLVERRIRSRLARSS
jgi:hypothetical protein